MTSETEPAPLSRIFKVDEIKDGASGEIIATEAEMNAIAGLLDLVRLEGLTFDYRFNHGGSGRLRLDGQSQGRRDANLRRVARSRRCADRCAAGDRVLA